MVTIRLKGEVTADGQLQFDLPENLPPRHVQITIEIPEVSDDFSNDEIAELLNFTPTSGAQVVAAGLTGGWEAKEITDPVAWVEEQRRKRRSVVRGNSDYQNTHNLKHFAPLLESLAQKPY